MTRKVFPNFTKERKRRSGETQYATNSIKTARYTPFSFFPKALLVQYTRVGIVFWTANSILMTWDAIATNSPITVFALVAFVIFLGMLKEWYSDSKRSKEDKRINEHKFKRLTGLSETTQGGQKAKGSVKDAYQYAFTQTMC